MFMVTIECLTGEGDLASILLWFFGYTYVEIGSMLFMALIFDLLYEESTSYGGQLDLPNSLEWTNFGSTYLEHA